MRPPLCKSVDRALVHLQVEQAVAVEIEVDALACAQGHGAELRLDHAVVADPGAQQGDAAAFAGFQAAGIAYGCAGVAGELVVAGEEVPVGQVQGGSHQAAYVDLGGLAEDHAVGIDQEDLAVGIYPPLDIAAVAADHPVQGDGVLARLVEADPLIGTDAELVPISDQLVALLVDDHMPAIGRCLESGIA